VGREEKFSLLLGLLKREGGSRILVFSNTREEARRLDDRVAVNGVQARALPGDVEQKKRLKILNDFKNGELPILVATDVASRGLHIEGVTHVVNWDMPQDAEDYVHRIGRTARAGATGKSISLADEAGALQIEPIEKFIGQKIPVEWAEDELFLAEIKPTSEERRRYADEKRARMAARGGRPRGGGARSPGRRGAERAGRRPRWPGRRSGRRRPVEQRILSRERRPLEKRNAGRAFASCGSSSPLTRDGSPGPSTTSRFFGRQGRRTASTAAPSTGLSS